MVREELGDTIDIHLGGADLIFPHHENEIAQSEAASGKPLARYWLHNGMVNVGGEKMSKSLGNFITIRGLLESGTSAMTLRLFVLQAHYRKPLDFTREALAAAETGWRGLNGALGLAGRHPDLATPAWRPLAAAAAGTASGLRTALADEPDLLARLERFEAAMDDDLNTAAALGELFDLARPLRALANRLRTGDTPGDADRQLAPRWQLLVALTDVLGLRHEADADSDTTGTLAESTIAELVEQRRAAKASRDFATADRLRDELRAAGIELVDKPGGVTVWLRQG
jgi:cysteinyl-tRNA synthetase